MRLQIVGVAAPLGIRPRIGLLADQPVHVLDQILDAGLLLLDLIFAVFAHEQVEHDLHLLDDLFLTLNRIAELVVLQQLGQRPELIWNASFLALPNRSHEQIGSLRVGLAEVFRELLKRVLKPQVAGTNRLLRSRQRNRSLACRCHRCGSVLRESRLPSGRQQRDGDQRQKPAEHAKLNRHETVSERTE